jgi:hypothetical protein
VEHGSYEKFRFSVGNLEETILGNLGADGRIILK